jgi:hypothetical protein
MAMTNDKQIESNNLKVLKDQIGYEALLNKKYSEYANRCNDSELKSLCNDACKIHKDNFNTLKTYLDSHQ